MLILLTTVSLMCAACAHDDSGPAPVPTAQAANPQPQTPAPVQAMPACFEVLRCAQKCETLYPYVDDQAIARDYSARGLLNSGAYQTAIQRNHALQDQQTACLGLPVNQVVSYP